MELILREGLNREPLLESLNSAIKYNFDGESQTLPNLPKIPTIWFMQCYKYKYLVKKLEIIAVYAILKRCFIHCKLLTK